MNAVAYMVSLMPPEVIRSLATVRRSRAASQPRRRRVALDVEQATAQVIALWESDLCGMLNALTNDELADIAARVRLAGPPLLGLGRDGMSSAALRAALWHRGAALERAGAQVSYAV